jgi:PAS domain S-box-containing protein
LNNKATATFDLFTGSGEIRALMRAHDWSCSPLGHLATWPQALRTVVSLMLDSKFPMFVAWGRELGFLYNDAYAEILGSKHPSALGCPFQDIWSEIWPDISPLINRALAGEATYSENLPLLMMRKGYQEQTWFTFSYSPVRDDTGSVAGMYCACTETTRHVIGEARQAFQLKMADLLRGLSDPHTIMKEASSLLGQELKANRVMFAEIDNENNLLVSRSNYTDGTVAELNGRYRPENFGVGIFSDLQQGWTGIYEDLLLDPRTNDLAVAKNFAAINIRSGILVPIIRGGILKSVLVVSHSTARKWTRNEVALAEDLAERTWNALERARAETALRIERDRSQGILDSMAEGFVLLDHDFRVLQINAGGLSLEQRPASEIIGKTHWEAWLGSEQLEIGPLYKQAMAERIPLSVEQFYTYPDGRSIWLEIRVTPSDEGLALIYHDVTERKRAEEELRQADRRKDEFLAMLAHELRNPLAPIGTAAQILKIADLDEKRVRETSEIIARQVDHMTSLVDDLLDVSRVTRGLISLEQKPLDLKAVVDSAIEQVRPLLETRHHRLTLQLANAPAHVRGDRVRLVQILANLLNNAAKYTPEGGNILLMTEAGQDRVELSVHDNGIGISRELLPNVFDLFVQGERSPDRSQGGLGLGLALAKSIVEHHGGSIVAESAGAGKGSKFTIRLPRLIESEKPAESRQTGTPAEPTAKSLRIMVVDDNADAAQTLATLLQVYGHTVSVAYNAHTALEQAMIDLPQVFILDIGLPDMDGYRLARELRALPEHARAVYIALTGYGRDHDRERSTAAQFDCHLVKPADTGKLAALLADIDVR